MIFVNYRTSTSTHKQLSHETHEAIKRLIGITNCKYEPLPYPQTPESVRAYFLRYGINRSEWARHFGISQQAISDLLRGQLKGTWGESHKTAVLLGLKPNPDSPQAVA